MKIKIFEFNPVSENTFVLYDESNECIIIDAGCYYHEEKEELLNFIVDNDLVVKHIINTHLHFDHVLGINFVTDQFKQPLQAHKDDEFLLDQFKSQLQMFGFPDNGEPAPKIEKYLSEGDIITFGNQSLSMFHVPGHSPGSLVYYNEKEKVMIAGDVLFRGSIGRTDLPQGNYEQLISGIKEKLMTLPSDITVYPGHGPATTIGEERENNPFLK